MTLYQRVAIYLGYLRNQIRARSDTTQRQNNHEYDDHVSMSPFYPEEQRPRGDTHEDGSNKKNEETFHQRQLVHWTRVLAIVTGALAFATFLVAAFSGWQVHEGRIAAIQQHEDTITTVEAAQRPWIAVEKIAHGDLMLTSDAPHIDLTYSLKNWGRAPAINVVPVPVIILRTSDQQAIDAQLSVCDQMSSGTVIGPFGQKIQVPKGFIVWPSDTVMAPITFRFSAEFIRYWKDIYRDGPQQTGIPTLVGCVSYKETSNSINNEPHTGMIYELDMKNSAGEIVFIDPRKGDVRSNDLAININPYMIADIK